MLFAHDLQGKEGEREKTTDDKEICGSNKRTAAIVPKVCLFHICYGIVHFMSDLLFCCNQKRSSVVRYIL